MRSVRTCLFAGASGAFIAALIAAGLAVPASAQTEPPPPPGANNTSCRPTAQHPYPVILLHGTFENRNNNWQVLSPELAGLGYCVWAFDYGANQYTADTYYGLAHVADSAQQLSGFVQQVLTQTGASQVDIVGHSQGGMMPRYYLGFLGGAPSVHALIALAPSNHGTTANGIGTFAQQEGFAQPLSSGRCDSCEDQLAGSPFMTKLNSIGDTVPGVTYTVIETNKDEVVTPYTSAFLSGPAVTNITVQDQCAADTSDHVGLAEDPVALHDVRNALDPATATPVTCAG
jgi:triacylglycerol esterase/lipase EstA (alpha/beta hydrolase family)